MMLICQTSSNLLFLGVTFVPREGGLPVLIDEKVMKDEL